MFYSDLNVMADLGFPLTAERIREELKQAWNSDNIIEWAYDNGYRIRKNQDSDMFTDETNIAYRWTVERELPPFCGKDGNRCWNGPTAKQALSNAINALKVNNSIIVPNWTLL